MTAADSSYIAQKALLEDIKILSGRIAALQMNFDNGIRKDYLTAIELEKLKLQLKTLRNNLVKPHLVWIHPNPAALPPPLKRTIAEIRAMLGIDTKGP